MKVNCVWEHNGNDTLLYADNFIGAFTRGETKEIAINKMQQEISSYLRWKGEFAAENIEISIVQEHESKLQINDADSDVIFDTEKLPLSQEEYKELKELALKSANSFESLYSQIPDKNKSVLTPRATFYGCIPCTALEMYEHTKCVNPYYFGEIGIDADTEDSIYDCRKRGFQTLEQTSDYLENKVYLGMGNEYWSLRKVIRRFIWHDRIHAKAMWRMARKTFGEKKVENIFIFQR